MFSNGMDKFKRFISKKNSMVALLVVIVVVATVSAFYFYNKSQRPANPTVTAAAEVADLVVKVGKLYELPIGETPTVATVSDKTKLADQPFFQRAENGDKVLIYSTNKKAILYRPSTNKIIEIAPVNLGNTPSTQSQTSNPSPTITSTFNVYIANGTKINGLASTTQKDLAAKSTKFVIVGKGDAIKSDYTQTLVVDVSGNNKTAADELAELVNGKVDKLPAGENVPVGVDLLIILGK